MLEMQSWTVIFSETRHWNQLNFRQMTSMTRLCLFKKNLWIQSWKNLNRMYCADGQLLVFVLGCSVAQSGLCHSSTSEIPNTVLGIILSIKWNIESKAVKYARISGNLSLFGVSTRAEVWVFMSGRSSSQYNKIDSLAHGTYVLKTRWIPKWFPNAIQRI